MKDKLFIWVYKVFTHFYQSIMWVVYKYKTLKKCKNVKNISPEYKREIRSFWKKYCRTSTKDFRWYKTKNNLKDVRLIPDVIFHSKIEPHFNNLKTMDAFSNKCYYNLLFQGYKVPYIIAKNINGMLMDDNFKSITLSEVIRLCRREKEVIIKPSIDSGGGRNITFISMEDTDSVRELVKNLKRYKKDFVIQQVITQHEELSKLNPSSLNSVRIQSFLYKGQVYILSSFIRVGRPGSRLDNIVQGGVSIAIKENGDFFQDAYDDGGNKVKNIPSSYAFEGKKMPGFDKMIEQVKSLHPRFANFGFIGWDIAVDENADPIFIEFNLIDTCISYAQLARGPLFQNLTEDVLDEVFGKKKK